MRRFALVILALLHAAGAAAARPAKPPLSILSALPLFWGEGDVSDIVQGRSGAAPSLLRLTHSWDVHPLDVVTAQALAHVDRLLVIQPPRLTPQELVALDSWVRQGGFAVILADPDLQWPQRRAAGDPRRAPQISLLSPLYRHWGVDLLPDSVRAAPRRARIGGVTVTLPGSGHWVRRSGACRLPDPALAFCRLGQGLAVLVADADFLQADAGASGDGRGFAALNHLLALKSPEKQGMRKGFIEKKP